MIINPRELAVINRALDIAVRLLTSQRRLRWLNWIAEEQNEIEN